MIHLAPRGNFKHQIDYHYFQNVISFSFLISYPSSMQEVCH